MIFMQQEESDLFRENRESQQIVIFIHGILEHPKQFRKLAQIAWEEGYSTCMLQLPGHGGSSHYFAKTSYKSWITYTSKYISHLAKKYKEIILVGHSMGTLLALCEAANRGKEIKALFLINPPLSVHIWPRVIKSALTISFGKIKENQPYTQAEYHAMGVEPLRLRDSLGWIERYSELLSMIYYTRKQIKKVSVPSYLIFAFQDEFVSKKSRKYFNDYKGTMEILYLSDSGHFCYHHSDLVLLEKAFLKFIREQYSNCVTNKETI